MYSFNGTGTTLYGKREIKSDGSYIATQWFILFYLPIFPMDSYRVLPTTRVNHPFTSKTNYARFEKVSLNKSQVINIYLSTYLGYPLVLVSIVLLILKFF